MILKSQFSNESDKLMIQRLMNADTSFVPE